MIHFVVVVVMGSLSLSTEKGTHLTSTREVLSYIWPTVKSGPELLTGVLQYLFEMELTSHYQSQLEKVAGYIKGNSAPVLPTKR